MLGPSGSCWSVHRPCASCRLHGMPPSQPPSQCRSTYAPVVGSYCSSMLLPTLAKTKGCRHAPGCGSATTGHMPEHTGLGSRPAQSSLPPSPTILRTVKTAKRRVAGSKSRSCCRPLASSAMGVSEWSPPSEQSSPPQPAKHAHSPLVSLHAPWPEHSLAHVGPGAASASAGRHTLQSEPEWSAAQRHTLRPVPSVTSEQ